MFLRIATIVVLGFLAFGCMLPAPFKTMDDRISIVDNPVIKSVSNISGVFREGYFHDQFYYRPLVNLSFMEEYRFFGLRSFFYNFDNLILHILNAILVFFLASRLCGCVSLGFWTGLLFVLHPVQWEAVCNIPGRAILLSTFFVLSTFILFLEFYKSRRSPQLVLAMITFFLGLLSKESTGVLPAVLFVYLAFDKTKPWLRKTGDLSAFLVVIGLYGLLRYYFGITKVYHADDPNMLVLGFVTFLRSVITDLRLFVLPLDLHFDRCLEFFMSLSYPPAILSLVFWAFFLVVLCVFRRSISGFVFFLMSWFALELLPVSQLITGIGVGTGHVSTAEHFLYLASVPVLIGMVTAARWGFEINTKRALVNPVILKFLVGGFLGFLLLISVEQSIYAVSEFSMLERSLAFEPNNPRIQGAMGLWYVSKGDIPDAAKHFKAAALAEPLNPIYHISLGTALCQQGKWIEGLGQLVALDPGKYADMVTRQEQLTMPHILEQIRQGKKFDAKGWMILGIYYARIGHVEEAISAFVKSADLNPLQWDVWMNLASLYEARQNWPAARAAYQKLLEGSHLADYQKEIVLSHLAVIKAR
ncbi:MAG: tetratricopeptide repeat protein [Candidatus Omnitrophica bacterium]|nr:tetratricopeptide repeat protein [Candidatus Omnitrophota bacterium]